MASEKGLTLAAVRPLHMAVYIKQMPASKPTIKQKLAVAPWMTHAIGRGFWIGGESASGLSNSSAILSAFFLFVSFVVIRRCLHHENRLSNTAIPDVSKRWPPNNKTNNIQRHPDISMTVYPL